MKNSTSALKVIGGVLISVAAGVALGILFAPDKGVKTRSKIIGNGKDNLKSLKKSMKKEGEKKKKKFKKASDHLLEGKFELQKDGSLSRSKFL